MFTLSLTVVPRSSINKLTQESQGLKLKITAAPVDGEANKKIIEFLAKLFACPKSSIKLLSGEKSKHKRFIFEQLSEAKGQIKLQEILEGGSTCSK